MLTITGLTKAYGARSARIRVLDGLDLSVVQGETVALTGESGSGKSTLLHLIAALDRPDSGAIFLDGEDLVPLGERARTRLRRDRFGLVFQQFNLVPSLTVAANIAFQARLAGRFDAAWCAKLTERLGLSGLDDRYPEQLSGGQQQRVAIGRSLAVRPDLLLADEPTGNLDEASAARVLDLMLDLVADSGTTLVMVTHSAQVAGRLGRTAHLRRGRIAE